MKIMCVLLIFVVAAIFAACSFQTVESQKLEKKETVQIENAGKKSPVLVELYTSEGCSSCPPADTALAFLEKEQPYVQAEIITLAFHVDYWNHLGWKDEFSSPLHSQRQAVYAQKLKLDSTYTPQMIVDGRIQFVGSNLGEASKAILEAAQLPKANIEIFLNADSLKIKIADVPKHEESSVFLAIAENNIISDVKRGENAGKSMTHTSVVRQLQPIGKIEAANSSYEQTLSVTGDALWKPDNISYVVFIQENNSRKIIGAAKTNLANK